MIQTDRDGKRNLEEMKKYREKLGMVENGES